MATIRARVAKTIQERQYEPITVEMEISMETTTVNRSDIAQEVADLEFALEKQVDLAIKSRK